MIPFGRDTVTLYNQKTAADANARTQTSWQRRVLTGCYWVRVSQWKTEGDAASAFQSVRCAIPQSRAYRTPDAWRALADTGECFTLAPGDLLVLGEVSDELGARFSPGDLLNRYASRGAFRVRDAQNNARHGSGMSHYLARG